MFLESSPVALGAIERRGLAADSLDEAEQRALSEAEKQAGAKNGSWAGLGPPAVV